MATGNAVGRDGVGHPGKAFSSSFRAPQSIRPAQDAAVRLDGGQADELGILPQGCYDVAIGPEQAQDGLLPAVPLERGMYLAHAGHVTKVEQGPRQSAGLLGVHLLQGPPIRLLGEGVHRSHLLLSAHRGLN